MDGRLLPVEATYHRPWGIDKTYQWLGVALRVLRPRVDPMMRRAGGRGAILQCLFAQCAWNYPALGARRDQLCVPGCAASSDQTKLSRSATES